VARIDVANAPIASIEREVLLVQPALRLLDASGNMVSAAEISPPHSNV
jgi:hypothetical protein